MAEYTIGIDFGSQSGRTVLVDITTGDEIATNVFDYPHGVMDKVLPDGTPLGTDYALQDPQDYLDVIINTIPNVLKSSKINAKDVIGIGIDFTACTVLPVKKYGTPLCFLNQYKSNPHAYVKLWKHHAAQDKANELNRIAQEMKQPWLRLYGGKISSEWMIPKLWQILVESPQIYEEMDYFIEAADWIVWQFTGKQTRNSCTAGYKAIWNKRKGYPEEEFFAALHPKMRDVVSTKLGCEISPLGTKAGGLTKEMAALTGLEEGTAVAVGNVDAHVTVPAVKIDGPGKMLAIMGTSTCHMLLGTDEIAVPGMCGCVEDGILPGYFGYEAGQSCVGDHFEWFVENCVNSEYYDKAKKEGLNIYSYLEKIMMREKPGESGLLALDWWNGNRSVLVDADLTGMMLGMTLKTCPEQIYRALVEATAFGTRKIIETFESSGVPVNEFYAAGGIAEKSPAVMQIYADIIKKQIKISGSSQGPALGSAIFGAVAGGAYKTISDAAEHMGKLKAITYVPNEKNSQIYDQLYVEYNLLHEYFGEGANNVMKRLKTLKMGK